MNWTEGALYRSRRGRLRKANVVRQRQQEYFARAPERAAQYRAALRNGLPAVSFLQPKAPSAQDNRAITPQDDTTYGLPKPVSFSRNASPPKLSSFLEDQTDKERGIRGPCPPDQQEEQDVDKLRQKLLTKEWNIQLPSLPQASKRPPPPSDKPDSIQAAKRARQKPEHLAKDQFGTAKPVNKLTAQALHHHDVRIRIGSQEKRLGETSSLARSALPAQEQSLAIDRHPPSKRRRSSTRSSSGR